ncbi:MAG: NAD-dependent epimerase/dehydratase family protein [Candidatus Eremiobacteraeota bacterium]|nr:NAD-dependent epimerase/dehydratase family protein [Candidatus Eremiobacteraeota bacterium]
MESYFIAGGAGFIGSHLARALGEAGKDLSLVIYDNFSSGRRWHLDSLRDHEGVTVVEGDIKDLERLSDAMKGATCVYHFASNPDIAKAMEKPDIDFWEGTYLTNNVVEAMRRNGVKKLLYASGSGVYGDTGLVEVTEDHAPLLPISTYGASKLACEALVCSYCHMFSMTAAIFRFANVVGPRQTHGVGYDFIRKLKSDPSRLRILGDGTQSKSYIEVSDVINAMRLVEKRLEGGYHYYNVATLDYLTVKEIADIVVSAMGLGKVTYEFSGGARGWKGDVPVVRFDSQKIRSLGWTNRFTSREAISRSVASLYQDALEGRI